MLKPEIATRLIIVAIAATSMGIALPATGAAGADGYLDHTSLTQTLQQMASTHARCTLDVIGASRQGRGLLLLTLAGDPATADSKPAILISAGLDGRNLVGAETAVRVARNLLEKHSELLDEMTVYVIPRVNPDAAEVNFSGVVTGRIATFRVTDSDHDGEADEDAPQDLDGDGFITMMRRANPPLDDAATHMADPAAPRLLKKPDAAKGEKALYAVYTEGLDIDGDGAIAEDGPGGVDLDRNFMHEWPEHEVDAGPYQLSEPESAALARFVLEHRQIVAAVTYGRHDNLVNTPDGKGKDVTGRGPKVLDPGDVDLYKELARRFKELTGQERAPKESAAGSFHAWLYAQRGIPSLATVVWGRPNASKPEGEDGEEAADDTGQGDAKDDEKADEGNDAKDDAADDEKADEGEDEKDDAEGESAEENEILDDAAEPKDSKRSEDMKKKGDKPADAEDAAWLDYSDRDRNGEGFTEWRVFDHPTLGTVEIGGFHPGFRMNPPAEELDALAAAQTAFVLDLMESRPRLSFEGPVVKTLADGLYDVRFGIVNDGYLPTATAMARRARAIPPTIVRISTPIEHIVAGDRVSRSWGIDGSGSRDDHHWIIQVEPGSEIEIEIVSAQLGNRVVRFPAAGNVE